MTSSSAYSIPGSSVFQTIYIGNRPLLNSKKLHKLTISQVINCVCEYMKIEPELIKEKKRTALLVKVRQYIHYFCRSHTSESLTNIAMALKQDHATVLHGIRKIKNLYDVYPDTIKDVDIIKFKLDQMLKYI